MMFILVLLLMLLLVVVVLVLAVFRQNSLYFNLRVYCASTYLMHRRPGMCAVCCVCCAVTEEVTANEGRKIEAESSFVSTQLVIVKPQGQPATDKTVEVRSCFVLSGVSSFLLFRPFWCLS